MSHFKFYSADFIFIKKVSELYDLFTNLIFILKHAAHLNDLA